MLVTIADCVTLDRRTRSSHFSCTNYGSCWIHRPLSGVGLSRVQTPSWCNQLKFEGMKGPDTVNTYLICQESKGPRDELQPGVQPLQVWSVFVTKVHQHRHNNDNYNNNNNNNN